MAPTTGVCPRCKAWIPTGATACACGYKLPPDPNKTQSAQPQQPSTPVYMTPPLFYPVDPYMGQTSAIASLVLAILAVIALGGCAALGFLADSIVMVFAFVIVLSISSVALGIRSLRTPSRAVALSGLVTSLVVLGVFVLGFVGLMYRNVANAKKPEPQTSSDEPVQSPRPAPTYTLPPGTDTTPRRTYGYYGR